MARPFELTVDNERLLKVLKKAEKVPSGIDELAGFRLFEVNLDGNAEDDTDIATVFGSPGVRRTSRGTPLVALARDSELAPRIGDDDRLHYADIIEHPEKKTPIFVKQPLNVEKKRGLRIITTGVLTSRRGGTLRGLQELMQEGKKLRYHGVFALTRDAADVVGEGIDLNITDGSKVYVDERFGRIKGLAGVPKSREALVSAVFGGPLLVGQVDGELKILEFQRDGTWTKHDVTSSARWQQRFMDLAEKDMVYLAAREEEEKRLKKQQAKYRVVKAPPEWE